MIATLDLKNKNIKLTSLARDTYVNIPGRGKGKLNAAYFWGKEDLLIKTIKENYVNKKTLKKYYIYITSLTYIAKRFFIWYIKIVNVTSKGEK